MDRLAELGYKQELNRTSLSMISILGLSFGIMAVPFGLSTTFLYGLTDGGPATIIWGWVFVSLISLCISASLAEICSAYPTAGGVYYWSAMLANKKWAPIASWITGWLTLVGNWTVTTSINFGITSIILRKETNNHKGGAQLILAGIALYNDNDVEPGPGDYVPNAYQTVLMFWAVTLLATLVNIFGQKYLDKLNTLCLYWTGASVIIILVTLLAMADTRRSAAFAFGGWDPNSSGWAPGWQWFVGLLSGAYTLTGYGMVAAMCEEVVNPEREVPRAMVLSVFAAGITGLFYLIPITFTLPDITTLLSTAATTGQPIPLLFKIVTGSARGGLGLLILILGIWFFAGVGSLTASSRCVYAFARDGAIPGSQWWSKVHWDLPLNGLLLSAVLNCLLGLIFFGNAAAFFAFTGCATICLSASYGLPVLVSVLQGRKQVKNAPYSLGKFGLVINIICIIWIAFAIILFCMPSAIPVEAATMNYASVVFMFFFLISAIWFIVWGRLYFVGPVSHIDDEGLEKKPVTNEQVSVTDDKKTAAV